MVEAIAEAYSYFKPSHKRAIIVATTIEMQVRQ
jgi:hypothetical protein